MELGIYTFGDITPDPNTGRTISIRQRYAEILAAAKLADEAGLDVFGVGEHHRLDIPISSPAAIMAAIWPRRGDRRTRRFHRILRAFRRKGRRSPQAKRRRARH